ncbi:MAG TPA: Ig-like domain repeat protein [Terracidiphilus sp.]|nr:Ig-like domain repeat protein [Terracidiphilus sp.]
MAIESRVMFPRVARIARLVLLGGLLPSIAATAQLPIKAPAPVTVGSVVPFNHGGTGNWIQIYSMKQDPIYGHILFLDSAGSVIYDMAPGASLPTEIVGPEPSNKDASDCSLLEFKGSYWNAAVAFDKWDNLYVTDRYGSAVQFCRVPYNAAAGTWTFSNADVWKGPTYTNGSGQTLSIPPQDLQVADDGVTFYVSTSSTSAIFKYQVDQSGNVVPNSVTALITGLEAGATQLAVDHAGNLYFVENQGDYPNNVHGIREIPAGSPTIVGDGTGTAEGALKRVDQGGWNGITGMFIDPQGDLYFGSTNNISYGGQADGVFMIPNEGTPAAPNLVWNDTVMVTPVDGGYPPMVDKRGFVWVATSYYNNWAPAGENGPQCDTSTQQAATATCLYSTIVLWKPGALSLGTTPVGGPSSLPITAYSVAAGGGSVTLTAKNSLIENQVVTITAGSGDPLFALNGLSFYVSGTGLSSTSFQISSSALTAGLSGSTSAKAAVNQTQALYYMFNQPATPTSFAMASPSNANFKTVASYPLMDNPLPTSTVNPCAANTSYPAFSANMTTTSAYNWCPYFVSLNTTKAGPVEGEVQVLGSGNAVIAGSNAYLSGVGQGPAVSVVSSATIQSIATGLNEPKQVAADLYGNTYVADAALKAIEEYPAGTTSPVSGKVYGSGLSAPSGVAVDGVGNLYIGDSGNVYMIPFVGGALATAQQTKIASGLGTGNLNLAVDGEGDVFVADEAKKQVVEIPNPQTQVLEASYPTLTLGSGFAGPSAIATDSSGNVWVADGANLFEISIPWGSSTKVASGLQSPVTGLAVDPSGSVFVAEANGLVWIPYSTTTGALNINSQILLASGLGSGPAVPVGVALDGSQNAYASYGSGSTAGLSQLGIGGTYNFSAVTELNPNVPTEVDAQILNLGNSPLTVSDDPAVDLFTGTSASDYTVAPATQNSPSCSSTTNTPPGGSCYLGMVLQAPAPGQTSASLTVMTNAVNATTGVNIAVSGNVIQDLRPATTATISVTPVTSAGCAGATYPGCNTIQVTVTAGTGYGTPSGTVTLSVGSANGNQPKQTQTLNSAGVATFSYSALLGGTYTVNADFSGSGTAGAAQNTCATTTCFAGSATKGTFTIARALPTITLGVPVTNNQCLNYTTLTSGTASSTCAANPGLLTVWAGNTYVYWTKPTYLSAIVSSTVGTPTGTVTFTQNGNPADPTQGVGGAIAPNGNGVATFLLQNLGLGVYNLSAVYSGDVNYAPVTVPVAPFYVISPSVQITVTGGATITPGTPAQVTLTLMPLVGFSENVSLECNSADAPIKLAPTNPVSTLPPYSECTFNYANPSTGTVAVGASGAVPTTIVMTISTNVAVNGGTSAALVRPSPWALAGMFGLGLFGLIAGRKKLYRSMAVICVGMMLLGLVMGMSACTNAGYSTPPPAPKVATPAGSYNVQIITYDPEALVQNSLTTPMFTLPVSVQ